MQVLIYQKHAMNDSIIIIIITKRKFKKKKVKEKPICGLIATFLRKLRALGKIEIFYLPQPHKFLLSKLKLGVHNFYFSQKVSCS